MRYQNPPQVQYPRQSPPGVRHPKPEMHRHQSPRPQQPTSPHEIKVLESRILTLEGDKKAMKERIESLEKTKDRLSKEKDALMLRFVPFAK